MTGMWPFAGMTSELTEVLLKRACRALRRVAICGDGRQGLIQRRASLHRPAQNLRASVSFCATRAG
jgi:hypothetical protein